MKAMADDASVRPKQWGPMACLRSAIWSCLPVLLQVFWQVCLPSSSSLQSTSQWCKYPPATPPPHPQNYVFAFRRCIAVLRTACSHHESCFKGLEGLGVRPYMQHTRAPKARGVVARRHSHGGVARECAGCDGHCGFVCCKDSGS